MINLLHILIQTEKERQEANRKCNGQMKEMASQIKTILSLQQTSLPPATTLPSQPNLPQPCAPTYADLATKKPKFLGHKPTIAPPARDDLRMLQPGKAIIHSNPLNDQLDKLPKALFVQWANKALSKLNA